MPHLQISAADGASDTLMVSAWATVPHKCLPAKTDEAALAPTSLHLAPLAWRRRPLRWCRPSNVYCIDDALARSSRVSGPRGSAAGSHDQSIISHHLLDSEAFSRTGTCCGHFRRGSRSVRFQCLRGKPNHHRIHFLVYS